MIVFSDIELWITIRVVTRYPSNGKSRMNLANQYKFKDSFHDIRVTTGTFGAWNALNSKRKYNYRKT
jgi:hypothetical protein